MATDHEKLPAVKTRTEVPTAYGVIVVEEMEDGTLRVNGDVVVPAAQTRNELGAT